MNADSVKAKLANHAREEGMTFQEVLGYYGLERTLYRISKSPFSDRFILKGGILLYALFDGNYQRATADIDFLARSLSNSAKEIESVFYQVFTISSDDALKYDLETLKVSPITEFKEYHGLNIRVTAYLDKTRIPISIDIGYGDVVSPSPSVIDFPTILEDFPILLPAYSIDSVVAEKLSAIVINGMLNTRYKDFYDIYILLKTYPFSEKALAAAIIETFENRRLVPMPVVDSFEENYIEDEIHVQRWNRFVKKKHVFEEVSIKDVSERCKLFLYPILTDISEGTVRDKVWDSSSMAWVNQLPTAILKAQEAFQGVAEELGLDTEDDIQRLVDEMRGKT